MLAEQQEISMSEDDFNKACFRLREIIVKIKEHAAEAASLLAKMSTPQLKKVKQEFRGIWSADHIDRLVLLGRGKIHNYLAMQQRNIPAYRLKRLPQKTLDFINNPNNNVEFVSGGKVRLVCVSDLKPMEWDQVLSTDGKIIPAEKQVEMQTKFGGLTVTSSLKPGDDTEIPESMRLDPNNKEYLLIKGKHTTMKVKISELRGFIKTF